MSNEQSEEIVKRFPSHQLPPPTRYIEYLDPEIARALANYGYDPETVRQQYNESARRRREAAPPTTADATDAQQQRESGEKDGQ